MEEKSKYPFIKYFPDNDIELFDEKKVLENREQKIKSKIKEKQFLNDNLLEYQKKLIVLDEMNSSNSSDNEKENESTEKSSFNQSSISASANDSTSTSISISASKTEESTNYSSKIIMDVSKDSKTEYWLTYELYDVKVDNPKANNLSLSLYQLNSNIFCYFYKNKPITYYYVQNVRFGQNYLIDNTIDDANKDYKEQYGLFFCNKTIEFNNNDNNTNKIIKCCPNEMICKMCMEKNKKRYKLDKLNYFVLININGRAAKKRKKEFHCYGHFFIGNQIEVCLQKFTCEGCKLLNKYENYYCSSN